MGGVMASMTAVQEAIVVPDLPPTDWLVMEVLAARRRLGEAIWTFPTTLRPSLRRLEARGLVGWKSGVIENTCRAWLTSEAVVMWLLPTYKRRKDDCGCLAGVEIDESLRRVCSLCGTVVV
jgi:hypothetical protein